MPILQHDLFPFTHYEYGEAYYGSYRGMRYRIAREPLKNVRYDPPEERKNGKLVVSIWKEPFAYNKTPADQIHHTEFDFTEEAFLKIADFLNQYWEQHRQDWPQSENYGFRES